MRVSVVAVGKPGALAPQIRDYEARAGRYWRIEVAEVPRGRGRVARLVLAREAELIRARVRPDYTSVALTRGGRRYSSTEFAKWMERLSWGPGRGVHFLVGGAYGMEAELRQECDLAMSLSPFTLPHDLARLVLAEQLYRAGTILRNEPYHKGTE